MEQDCHSQSDTFSQIIINNNTRKKYGDELMGKKSFSQPKF